MKIYIKDNKDILKMKIVGRLVSEVLEMIEDYIQPGISTEELNNLCHQYIIKKQKAYPASLGYKGFPKAICTSINDVVCHGIPNIKEKLKEGDILNIDVSIIKDGFYSDASRMFLVGKCTKLSKNLCEITKKSLYLAIYIIKPGIYLNEIGKTIQEFVEKENFSIVKNYCGHGIGVSLHEDPKILHYNTFNNNIVLKPGMIFTVEPIVNEGKEETYITKDKWTVKTKDKKLSAQYEHTILVTNNGCEIITIGNYDTIPFSFSH